ncbi:hypothetical protein KC332_g1157 [Hortaea werneckii]|uniref:F-box domain-containing protein n=2 Tax=Hortaea werneckii TaxID=91943 RepID=A0A3M7ITB2_HORWE|nr:hypothetical protein KC358_g4266 [Hortaea werneckii]OTA29789.1 hypothetical protein BTJ68_08827 [Hortaea werneckii EXF-2000]KAI6846751.1 hypothetical protein KC350_g3761 [Hortaea werneckii]KAI6944085.1 hypothetical protein KC348_g4066 [Hortaea werneckii]KAI6944449.1 hypothetical protein KC341_g790 [Hortaea werneckii]
MELPVRTRKDSAVSAKKGQQQKAPRTTFLILPSELRDQIYGYLLSHEYTKMPPYHIRPAAARGRQSEANKRDMSAAHTYRFHVNILGVNKQLRKEATEELYGRNDFVVVSWRWEELGETLHAFDLPIVTDNQAAVARFVKSENHSFRLHLDYPGVHEPVESLLMLHSDLKVFCRVVRYLGALLCWPAHFVIKQSKSAGDCFGAYSNHIVPALRTMIQINRVIAASEAEAFNKKAKLLAPLVDLRIAGQKLKVLRSQDGDTQIQHANVVDDLTNLAAPSLAWVKIVAWDLLDISLALMAAANKLCRDGDYGRAYMHYESILIDVPRRHFLCTLPHAVVESDAAPPVVMGLYVLLDAVIASGFLSLRHGDIKEVAHAHNVERHIFDLITCFPNREEILFAPELEQPSIVDRTPSWHFSALASFFVEPLPVSHYVDVFEDLHQHFPNDLRIAHDLKAFVRLSEGNQTIALNDRPQLLAKFSARAFPPQASTFQIPEHIARPTRLSGWHDQEQYEDAASCFKNKLKLGVQSYVTFPKQKD